MLLVFYRNSWPRWFWRMDTTGR